MLRSPRELVPAEASVLHLSDPAYDAARTTYLERHRRLRLPDDQPVVRLVAHTAGRLSSRITRGLLPWAKVWGANL